MTTMVIPGNSLAAIKNLRLITFDVTGTLLQFVKPPVQQYIDIGRRHGVLGNEARMNQVFKQQWLEMNEAQPNYGTCWRSWWTEFVVETFKKSKAEGAMTNETLHTIASDLIEHFNTAECWEAKNGAVELLLAVKHLGLLESTTTTTATTMTTTTRHHDHDDENDDLGGGGSNSDSSCSSSGSGRKKRSSNNNSSNVREAPLQIGVLSNFDSRLEKILQVTNLHPYFDFFITSHECRVSKPNKGIFDQALLAASTTSSTTTTNNTGRKKNFVQPHEALHIGDSYNLDYVGARSAGWNAFLVLSPEQQKKLEDPDILRQKDPPVVFPDLMELRRFFEKNIS